MKTDRFFTVRNRDLSLWMSSVQSLIHATDPERGSRISQERVLPHPMMQGVRIYAQARENGQVLDKPVRTEGDVLTVADHAYLAQVFHDHAEKRLKDRSQTTTPFVRDYSTYDILGWASCGTVYIDYKSRFDKPIYHNWMKEGNGDPDYGVIPNKLPNDARVALVGDWGTGMDDAKELVRTILNTLHPTVFIHLGDIYYSGTPEECRSHVLNLFREVFAEEGRTVPVFTIPGNHDYYAMGAGYYPLINDLNQDQGWKQVASYFALRTEDHKWQFQAMDTGIGDDDPFTFFSDSNTGPGLVPDEIDWHKKQFERFTGSTILLSHHQLFSSHSAINGSSSGRIEYYNEELLNIFSPHFDQIKMWLWGHEHNYVLYQDGTMGLTKGRLVGCSGYEESDGEDPYDVNYPQIPYRAGMARLATYQGYYNHGCALIDLARLEPDSPITISYYQYPTWGQNESPPNGAALSLLNREAIGEFQGTLKGLLGTQFVTFTIATSSQTSVTVEEALNPPPGTGRASICLQGYDASYKTGEHFDFGRLQLSLEVAPASNSATVTMSLRDNHENKREWQGSVNAVVYFFLVSE